MIIFSKVLSSLHSRLLPPLGSLSLEPQKLVSPGGSSSPAVPFFSQSLVLSDFSGWGHSSPFSPLSVVPIIELVDRGAGKAFPSGPHRSLHLAPHRFVIATFIWFPLSPSGFYFTWFLGLSALTLQDRLVAPSALVQNMLYFIGNKCLRCWPLLSSLDCSLHKSTDHVYFHSVWHVINAQCLLTRWMNTLEGLYISLTVPWESSTLVIILIILPHLSLLHCQFQVFQLSYLCISQD